MKNLLKHLLIGIFLFTITSELRAQTDNYALRFAGTGIVDCGIIQEINTASAFTFQTWINIDTWVDGASVVNFMDANQKGFSISLGSVTDNTLNIKIASATSSTAYINKNSNATVKLLPSGWHHLSVVYNGSAAADIDKLVVYVDDVKMILFGATGIPSNINPENPNLMMGTNFIGRMDDMRLWSIALTATELLRKNTISPYHEKLASVISYWKCDQFTSPSLVDYRLKHNGAFIGGVSREKVTDNALFFYRSVMTYMGLHNVARATVNNKHLLLNQNDIGMFGLDGNTDTGVATLGYADDQATFTNVDWREAPLTSAVVPTGNDKCQPELLTQIEQVTRSKTLYFKGTGSQMDCGSKFWSGNQKATFSTWLYVNTWTPGVSIFERTGTNGDLISLKMGTNDGEFIFTISAIVSGVRYTEVYPFTNEIVASGVTRYTKTTGTNQYWHYLNFAFNGANAIPVSLVWDQFNQTWATRQPVILNTAAVTSNAVVTSTMKIKTLPSFSSGNNIVGKNFDGYMDDITFWAADRTDSQRRSNDAYTNGLGIATSGVYYTISNLSAYYRADNGLNPGQDEMTFKSLLAIFLKQFAGYRGYRIRLSCTLSGSLSFVTLMTDNPSGRRDLLADNLAAICSKSNNGIYDFDGVDLDYEWSNTAAFQVGYGKFISRLKSKMPSGKILSVAASAGVCANFTQEAINNTDYFSSQDYGPHYVKFDYSNFTSVYTTYKGTSPAMPDNKMLLSYGSYGVGGVYQEIQSTSYTAFVNQITSPDQNSLPWTAAATSKTIYFCGATQVKQRAQFVMDKNIRGLMYFDMPSDVPATDSRSLARAHSQIIAANVDSIVEVSVPVVQNIAFSNATVSADAGTTLQMQVNFTPANGVNQHLNWTSSNPSIATVNANGLVTAIKQGVTTIQATTIYGNLSTSTQLTVNYVSATSVTIVGVPSSSISSGSILALSATILPTNSSSKSVVWSSNNPTIAEVTNDGTLIAHNAGNATITASIDAVTNSFNLTVVTCLKPVSSIAWNEATSTIFVGTTKFFQVNVLPIDATVSQLTWSSSNPAIASVNEAGLVSALTVGETVLTAKSIEGAKVITKTLNVVDILVGSITITNQKSTLTTGDILMLGTTFLPIDASVKRVIWSSSNDNIANVTSDGLVTAIYPGLVTITASAIDGSGISASFNMEVLKIPVQSISIAEGNVSMPKGTSRTLSANILPNNATFKDVTWSSSDQTIVSVSPSGILNALLQGNVTITMTSTDDGTKIASINVASTVALDSIKITNAPSRNLILDETYQLVLQFYPPDATNKAVNWSSSKSNVIYVYPLGLVEAFAYGTQTITAIAVDGLKKASCVITCAQQNTAVGNVHDNSLCKIWSVGAKLYANNLVGDIYVYNLQGTLIRTVLNRDAVHGVSFSNGMYIVKSVGITCKVVVSNK